MPHPDARCVRESDNARTGIDAGNRDRAWRAKLGTGCPVSLRESAERPSMRSPPSHTIGLMTTAIRTPNVWQSFTPKLFTTLREGYSLGDLRHDAVAGLTVAIVALPLSLALA